MGSKKWAKKCFFLFLILKWSHVRWCIAFACEFTNRVHMGKGSLQLDFNIYVRDKNYAAVLIQYTSAAAVLGCSLPCLCICPCWWSSAHTPVPCCAPHIPARLQSCRRLTCVQPCSGRICRTAQLEPHRLEPQLQGKSTRLEWLWQSRT